MTWSEKFVLRLQVCAVLGAIGCPILIAVFLPGMLAERAAAQWPTAEGEITDLTTEAFSAGKNKQNFLAKPIYKYSVNGQEYTGSKMHLGGGLHYSTPQAAAEGMAEYQVGQKTPVHYDPAAPATSTLKVGIQAHQLYVIIGMAILSVVCWIGCIFAVPRLIASWKKAGEANVGAP